MLLACRLVEVLEAIGSKLHIITEVTVMMPPSDAPEPDVVLTDEPEGDGPVPLPSVALVVDIADSSLVVDLGRKAALYACAGVPGYWVMGLREHVVHRM